MILRVGVARALYDPDRTLKGIYLLACICAGGIGAAAFVIFRNGGLLLSCTLGGFVCSLYFQAFKSNGIIQPIGLRYILYLALSALTFSFACHSRLQSYILIFSSALVGSTTTILGIDCFTRANLKEFYIRNLGFDDLFEKKYPTEFAHHRWFLSTASIIELGVLGGLTIMAISFQGKMWAEFRASLLTMRRDDEERKLQAKAKRAAKTIFANAQRDLRDWEEKHGYRKTASKPVDSLEEEDEEDYPVQAIPSSEMEHYHGKGSVMSLSPVGSILPTSAALLEYRPLANTIQEPTLAESMGLHTDMSRNPSGGSEPKSAINKVVTAEQQALLDEIANIRKSIDVLKSASPGTIAFDGASDHRSVSPLDVGKRASSASMMNNKFKEENPSRTPSPWMTTHRLRSRSISGLMGTDPCAVNPELFAGSDNVPQYQMTPSFAFDRDAYLNCASPSASVQLPSNTATMREARARSGSESRVLERALPASVDLSEEYRRKSMGVLESEATHPLKHNRSSSPHQSGRRPSRIIIDTEGEAAARYAIALNRGEVRSQVAPKKRSKEPITPTTPTEKGKRSTMMSMGELQARHQSRMKALQGPASERVVEEANIIKAKEQWTRRSQMEKKRWDTIQKLQQQRSSMKPDVTKENRPRRSSRSKSLSAPIAIPTAPLSQMPQQSGTSKAKEWRKTLILSSDDRHRHFSTEPEKQLSDQYEAMRRRHSEHTSPLLNFKEDK